MRLALAALLAFGAASVRAATTTSGTVLKADAETDSLVIVDKAGQTSSYSINGRTKVTSDGKDVKFDNDLIGELVVRAKFNPKTKTLTVLDLKSSAGTLKPVKKAAAPETVSGEIAFADALKGTLSVKTGKGATRDFVVAETTKVLRRAADKPASEIGLENVMVGDAVEVDTRDGKTADQIVVRPAAH